MARPANSKPIVMASATEKATSPICISGTNSASDAATKAQCSTRPARATMPGLLAMYRGQINALMLRLIGRAPYHAGGSIASQ